VRKPCWRSLSKSSMPYKRYAKTLVRSFRSGLKWHKLWLWGSFVMVFGRSTPCISSNKHLLIYQTYGHLIPNTGFTIKVIKKIYPESSYYLFKETYLDITRAPSCNSLLHAVWQIRRNTAMSLPWVDSCSVLIMVGDNSGACCVDSPGKE